MLTEKERKYLSNLILNDLLEWEDFWDTSTEAIDRLKEYTLQKWISERIWLEQYSWNLRKILKYQYETAAPDRTILKTIFHIVSSYAIFKSETYWIDCCCIYYMLFWEKYWYDIIDKDPYFFDVKNKDREVNRDLWTLSRLISTYSMWDNDESENDYISLMKWILDNLWYEEWDNFLKIVNRKLKWFKFSVVYLQRKNWIELDNEKKKQLFNPWNLSYWYHPLVTWDYDIQQIKEHYYVFMFSEYLKLWEYSKDFLKFIFDSFFFHIIKRRNESNKEMLQYFQSFKDKYKELWRSIRNNKVLEWYTEKEYEIMRNQFLFLDLMESRYKVMSLLEELPINDLRKLFNYLHDNYPKSLWYNYWVDKNNKDNLYYSRYLVFELSRIFLHKQIKKEQFDWLNSIYDYATDKKNTRVWIFYNLVMWKFSLSYIRVWTEYFLQWYWILLKQLFKNFWLWTPWKELEKFKEIWKEVLNEDVNEEYKEIIDITELQDDIYTKDYAYEILKKYDIKDSEYENMLLDLWYNIKTWFILKDTYKSFNEYLFNRINEWEDIFLEKDLIRNILIYNTLAEYCRKYVLFKIDDDLYIPLNKLEKEWLNTEYIRNFFNELKNEFWEKDFFSVKNIREKIDTKVLDSFWFGDNFLENIIFYNEEIWRVKIGNHKIFSYIFRKPTIVDFIEEKMKDYKRISVDDFSEKSSEEYWLDINYNKIIVNLSKLENVYYAKNLDTLYLNKQDFINEVYWDDWN